MGALAGLLQQLGHDVSGSDTRFDPPVGPALRSWGIRCLEGFDPAHLDTMPDVVVVGNVCRPDNPEAQGAFTRHLRVEHIAQTLREFVLNGTSPLVVAGTHGKTTTTALSAYLLDRAGLGPGMLIGGLPVDFERSARAPLVTSSAPTTGRKVPFVIEGDEYDTAFFEKTAKFLHYGADVAILTSIEHDHIDIYPTFAEYRGAFARFVEGIPSTGRLVAYAGDANVVGVVSGTPHLPVSFYALTGDETHGQEPSWVATPQTTGEFGTTFQLSIHGHSAGEFATRLVGDYNVRNVVAALAACHEGYQVPIDQLRTLLPGFQGVCRRQQVLGTPRGIHVIDDFAHHPTAVAATLGGLRQRFAQGRLLAVFEPRSATACRKLHQAAYALAFDAADAVFLSPVGRNLPVEERLDVCQLAEELRTRGRTAEAFPSVEAIVERLGQEARAGDCIALLSNGNFGGIHGKLLSRLGRVCT